MRTILLYLMFFGFTQGLFSQTFENLALTPPMGWNSWNCFRCAGLNEDVIKEIADAMVSSGMKDAGYEYIVIDDCWQIDRDEEGNIIVDASKFPSGMKVLADYVHSKGLKLGIYSCAGSKTCQGRPGSRGYQFQDARQYAEWGVDYLKYDWCYSEGQSAEAAYRTMSDAIKASGRPMVFSICEWGYHEPWKWGKGIGHLWRTTQDIRDCWDCEYPTLTVSGGIIPILEFNRELSRYAGPGHWNDADMLEVGNEALSETESIAHFSLWSIMASPLMAGNDLRNMDEATRKILTNKEVIAINQDSLGQQGTLRVTFDDGKLEVYLKNLSNHEKALLFFNRSDKNYELDLSWAMLEIEGNFKVRDVWEHSDVGTTHKNERIDYDIPNHGVKMFRLTPVRD